MSVKFKSHSFIGPASGCHVKKHKPILEDLLRGNEHRVALLDLDLYEHCSHCVVLVANPLGDEDNTTIAWFLYCRLDENNVCWEFTLS